MAEAAVEEAAEVVVAMWVVVEVVAEEAEVVVALRVVVEVVAEEAEDLHVNDIFIGPMSLFYDKSDHISNFFVIMADVPY